MHILENLFNVSEAVSPSPVVPLIALIFRESIVFLKLFSSRHFPASADLLNLSLRRPA